ncbi:acyltransferase family protein [Flavitalea antarctica]
MYSSPLTLTTWIGKSFNLKQLNKSRYHWVDYLKGIAILLVVYRHVLIGIERSGIIIPGILQTANLIFYSFRMPLFFILSGLFINSSIAKRRTGELIFMKFENILYPYLIWSFLQISIQILFASSTNSQRTIIDYTYIFYQPRELDQFWYLPALFNTSVIYLLLKTRLRIKTYIHVTIGLVFFFISPYLQKISMISDWMGFYIFFALGDVISVLFFRESSQKVFKKPFLALIFLPVFVATQVYYLQFDEYFFVNDFGGKIQFLGISLIGCFAMFLFAVQIQEWKSLTFLRMLGMHSLQIYVMHVFVASVCRILLMKFAGVTQPVTLLISGITVGVLVPVMLYNLFIRNGMLWFLFSLHKNQKTKLKTQKAVPDVLAS